MAGNHPTYPESSPEDELRNARLQALIYQAIVTAANDAHAVLDLLLEAADPDDARQRLQDRYRFTEVQATAVLDVQFRRLTSVDRHKIDTHLHELEAHVDAWSDSSATPEPLVRCW